MRARIVTIFALALAATLVTLAVSDRLGILIHAHVQIVTGIAVLGALAAAFAARTTQPPAFFVNDRNLPPAINGLVMAMQLAGFGLIGLVALIYTNGVDIIGFAVGWAGGLVLLSVLFSAYLRKTGAVTIGDYFGERFDSPSNRLIATFLAIAASLPFLIAHIHAMGFIAARITGLSVPAAVQVCGILLLLIAVSGGARSTSWAALALVATVVAAALVPAMVYSIDRFAFPLPQLAYGELFEDIAVLARDLSLRGLAPEIPETGAISGVPVIAAAPFTAIAITAMAGTACLPAVLMRLFASRNADTGRIAIGWALIAVFAIAITVPAYAIYAKAEIFQAVIGQNLATLPQWLFDYGRVGLVEICGQRADSAARVVAACGALPDPPSVLRLGDVAFSAIILFPAFGDIAGLWPVVAALGTAGALAALIASAGGAVIAIAHALSHDLVHRLALPDASTATRLLAGRLAIVATVLTAMHLSATVPINVAKLICWSVALAGGSFFAPLFLSIWWRRFSRAASMWSMICGALATFGYIYFIEYEGMRPWFGIGSVGAGVFGVATGLFSGVAATSLTGAPKRRMLEFVDRMRVPTGDEIIIQRRRSESRARAQADAHERAA